MIKFINKYWDLIIVLSLNYLKIKYKRTVLGFFWSLLNPLISVGVISLVFSAMLGMNYKNFVATFFPAFIAWNFFANSINGSTISIINNENLIKKAPIDPIIFPLVNVTINFIELILTFISFIVILFIIGYNFSYSLFFIFFSIIFLLITTIGASLIVSVISTFLRDASYLIGIFMQLWFYVTPVLYPKDFIKGKYWLLDIFIKINPMTYFIEMFRDPITYHHSLNAKLFFIGSIISTISILGGIYIFNKYKYKLVYWL